MMTMGGLAKPRKIYLFLLLFCGILSTWALTVAGQEDSDSSEPVSIGVVDRQQIIRDSLAGESLRNEFEAKEKSYREEISDRENGLRAQQEELARQRAILTPDLKIRKSLPPLKVVSYPRLKCNFFLEQSQQ